jgi:hypothetical protein
VQVRRPRVRRTTGGEAILPSVAAFRDRDPLTARMMQQLLAGVSMREYEGSLEGRPLGRRTRSSSKSAVSRAVVRRTRQRLQEQLTRRLEGLEVVALFMDGLVVAQQTVIVVLGITRDGHKEPLGLRLPLFKRRTEEVGRLLPELYLHGLAQGDFELALRGLLGAGAPLSASSVARLKASWQAEYDTWRRRRLDDLEPVYLWADGIYVKAGLEKDKAAMLVLIAALRDGRKMVLAVEGGYRESTESWAAVLRDLKSRGLRAPRLLIADGHLGIWSAVGAVFPERWGAAFLEPPAAERARQVAEEAAGRRARPACEDPVRRDAGGGRAVQARVPGVGDEEGRARGRPAARCRLGAPGDLLSVPEGPLEAPEDDQRRGVAVCGRAVANGRREAVQEGRERDGDHLEDTTGCGSELPTTGRPRALGRGR